MLALTASFVSIVMAEETTVLYLMRNTSKTDRTDQPVVIDLKSFGRVASAIVQKDGKEIPCQLTWIRTVRMTSCVSSSTVKVIRRRRIR